MLTAPHSHLQNIFGFRSQDFCESGALDEGEEELVLSLLLATNDYDVEQRLVEKDRTLHLPPPLAVKDSDGICLVELPLRLLFQNSSCDEKLETGMTTYWKL